MGGGRAEGSSAIRDKGQAAISPMPDVDGTHVPIFESLQLEGSYIGDVLYKILHPTRGKYVKNREFNQAVKRLDEQSYQQPQWEAADLNQKNWVTCNLNPSEMNPI